MKWPPPTVGPESAKKRMRGVVKCGVLGLRQAQPEDDVEA
jgi:hypothetical protein